MKRRKNAEKEEMEEKKEVEKKRCIVCGRLFEGTQAVCKKCVERDLDKWGF